MLRVALSHSANNGIHMGRKPKLTEHQQAEALNRLAKGHTCRTVAKTYGELGHAGLINIERLASYPLLLLDGYSIRRMFDAACRLANVKPKIALESRASHTLLALAEAGQGVAIVPSLQRTDRYKVRVARITHGGKPIRERVAIHWDRRRPLPPYAVAFCESLAEYMHKAVPITQVAKAGRSTAPRKR
jgi:DNA-binding transcriptional LysR family regulator